MQDTINTNSEEFHLLATFFNMYATKSVMQDIIDGDGTTQETVNSTVASLQGLGYDADGIL